MNRKTLWISIACLVLPILTRMVWFYPGFSMRPAVATPDYASMAAPTAPPEKTDDEHIKQFGGVVLIDQYHSNQFQPNEIESLTQAIALRGGKIEFVTDSISLATRLKYAKAYMLISPSIPLSSDEEYLIHKFTDNGGKLMVFTDATRGILAVDFFSGSTTQFPDVNSVNPLLEKYDISVDNDYLYNLKENDGNFRNVLFTDFGKSELTFGLKEVVFYGSHSLKSPSGLFLLQGTESTFSSLTDAPPSKESTWSAGVLSEDESTLVFGDFTFLTTPFNSVASNQSFIGNIADFMLKKDRKTILANFPYIFQQKTISILPTSGVQMTAEMVSALSRLQSGLSSLEVDVNIVDSAPRSGDLIVLGTFSPTDDLASFTKPFDITLDDSNEFVEIPKFGKVGKKGNGILLLEPDLRENTLTLLADSADDLIALMTRVTGKDLIDCILTEKTGVCSIGSGGEFSTEPPALLPVEETPVTATPSG